MSDNELKQPLSSASDLFNKSKEAVLRNISTYVILFILPFFLSLGANIKNAGAKSTSTVPNFSGLNISAGIVGLGVGIGLVALALSIIVNVMTYALNLGAAEGKKMELNDLWPIVSKYWLRLMGLLIVTAFIIIGGFLLLIVPGIIFIGRYFMAPYVMIDKDLSIGESLRESARISKGNATSIWIVILMSAVLSLPGIVPVIGWVISFILTSLFSAAPAIRYLELKKISPAYTAAPESPIK